jgi:hypothetical protein
MRNFSLGGSQRGSGGASQGRGSSLGLLKGGGRAGERRGDWDGSLGGLSELIESDLVVTVGVKSSDDGNDLSVGGNETIESQEGLDVSVVEGVVSKRVNGLKGSTRSPVVSKVQLSLELLESDVEVDLSFE